MSTRVVDVVDDWDEQSFTGGYRTLHELADEEFSGVCRAGGAELYMTSGTVVGVLQGSIEDFEGGEGTTYQAPSPALPLLAVMQERSDEVRAQYYTEETPIAEVDRTLSDGGFSGYVELSENVLSGDYYLVYYAGRSMSVAFVGASSRLSKGTEAFETADDEVGIYEVRPVDIEPIDIPEPEEPEPDPAPAAGTAAGTPTGEDTETETGAETETEIETGAEADGRDDAGSTGEDDRQEVSGTPEAGTGAAASTSAETEAESALEEPADEDATGGTSTATDDDAAGETSTEDDTVTPTTTEADETSTGEAGSVSPDAGASAGAGTASVDRRQSGRERRDRSEPSTQNGPGTATRATAAEDDATADLPLEKRAIPSLDPDRTTAATGTEGARVDAGEQMSSGTTPEKAGAESPEAETGQPQQRSHAAEPDSRAETATGSRREEATDQPDEADPAARPDEAEDGRIDELEGELAEQESEIERLEAELDGAQEERETLEAELESVREERDELAAEVERLESQLEQLEAEFGAAPGAEQQLTPAEALEGTDIFVRYESKGKATLEKAHDGGPRKEKVNENLRLEKHTQFDASAAAVGSQSYDAFLEETMEFQFVRWMIRELLFEIRDTGHTDGLKDLYDALPKVDRAELSGTIATTYTEDGQENRGQESFDLVLRDRMGNPLLVANLNDSREAATQSMMEGIVTAAERVGQSKDSFAGAFLVTRSFFEPEALETASEATKGGLLSRDKRESFVNLSRKRGYHLCLVEARKQQFNLAVPDL